MKVADNASILAQLGRELGVSEPLVIFEKARSLANLPNVRQYAAYDYREYMQGGELILPDYVRRVAFELLEVVADSS